MTTKRVSEMTPSEYAAYKKRRRTWLLNNRDKLTAAKKRWMQTPAGKVAVKAAAKRWRQKDRESDSEACRAKDRVYGARSRARSKDKDIEEYRARKGATYAKYYAQRTSEQRQTRKALDRRRYWRNHPLSRAKLRETMAVARAAIPRYAAPDVRDDVVQNLLVAVSDGTIRLQDIAAKAPEFLRAYNRQFDHHKVMSLDANIPGMKATWLDALPDDAERY
jgi:hypothetical protein